jgi:hypothetical protein
VCVGPNPDLITVLSSICASACPATSASGYTSHTTGFSALPLCQTSCPPDRVTARHTCGMPRSACCQEPLGFIPPSRPEGSVTL